MIKYYYDIYSFLLVVGVLLFGFFSFRLQNQNEKLFTNFSLLLDLFFSSPSFLLSVSLSIYKFFLFSFFFSSTSIIHTLLFFLTPYIIVYIKKNTVCNVYMCAFSWNLLFLLTITATFLCVAHRLFGSNTSCSSSSNSSSSSNFTQVKCLFYT